MTTRLEIRKVDGLWCVGMNGVIVSSSHFKTLANKVVEDVIRINPDVEFYVKDEQKNARGDGR